HLRSVVPDDQLAAFAMRHAVLRAELVEAPAAVHAQARLERAGRVVHAGVDDAAVVRAGVLAWPRVPLEQHDRAAALRDRARGGEAGDAGADYGTSIRSIRCARRL